VAHWYTCEDTACGWNGCTTLHEPDMCCPDCDGPVISLEGPDSFELLKLVPEPAIDLMRGGDSA